VHEVFSAGLEEMHSAVNAAMAGALLKPAKKEQEPGLFGRVLSTVSRAADRCGGDWSEIKELENYKKDNTVRNYQTQGLAVGTTYCYSFEIDLYNQAKHKLYRIHKTNNALEPMTNKNSAALGHANDVAFAKFKDKNNQEKLYMYVLTFEPKNGNNKKSEIVKLEYDASGNYWEKARYDYNSLGTLGNINFNGISLIGNTSTGVEFMLQANNSFYRVVIPFDNDNAGGQIYPSSKAFSISKPKDYGQQTFHYEKNKDRIYVIWAGTKHKNKNVVHVYRNIDANNPKKVKFWDVDGENKFELEGGGFYGDTYWFSTFEGYNKHSNPRNGRLFTHSKIQ